MTRRPKLARLFARATARTLDVVYVLFVGQLARGRIGALGVVRRLDALGVKVVSVNEPWFDVHAPALKWISDGEARRLDKSKRAIEAKRQRGERVGEIRLGLRLAADGVSVEPDPDEERLIAEARRFVDEGYSYRVIAETLTERGYRSRQGTPISHRQVARMAGTRSG